VHFRGHYTLEQFAQIVDRTELVEAGS